MLSDELAGMISSSWTLPQYLTRAIFIGDVAVRERPPVTALKSGFPDINKFIISKRGEKTSLC
jgi:hypothetical protein